MQTYGNGRRIQVAMPRCLVFKATYSQLVVARWKHKLCMEFGTLALQVCVGAHTCACVCFHIFELTVLCATAVGVYCYWCKYYVGCIVYD